MRRRAAVRPVMLFWLTVGLLFFLLIPGGAWAAEIPVDLAPDLGELEQAIDEAGEYLGDYLPRSALRELWQDTLAGRQAVDLSLLQRLFSAVFVRELGGVLRLFAELLLLAVFGLLLAGFAGGEVAKLAETAVGLAAAGLAVRAFMLAGGAAGEAVGVMSDFVYALLPVLLTLLAAMGGGSTVALFNPALLAMVSAALHILRAFVLPLLYVSGALTVGGRLSGGLKLSGLAKLSRDLAMGVFGVMLTVFSGLLGLLGLSSAALSGLGYRAVKSAGSAFIPVVGRTLADALDSVLGTALLLKNIIGVAGIIIVLLICILPGLKILLMYAAFRLAGALAEPLGNSSLSGLLNDMAAVVVLFFGVVAAAGLFFFFLISIIIGMGNIMLALR